MRYNDERELIAIKQCCTNILAKAPEGIMEKYQTFMKNKEDIIKVRKEARYRQQIYEESNQSIKEINSILSGLWS